MNYSSHHINRSYAAILASLAVLWGCKDPYSIPYQSPVTGYLVVEGYISSNSTTQFTLSCTVPLPGNATLPKETGANVEVDGTDGSVYRLNEIGNGVYSDTNALPLNTASHYQLRIKTLNGDEYLSDIVPFKPTPPIDSLNFVQNSDYSVTIYVNTHDPANNTRYYQWRWDQTFEYHSAEESLYYWDKPLDSVLLRPDTAQVFKCWLSGSSGSIFDAQPTALKSNIHSLTNPSEEIIGYVSAGTVQQYRLWISRDQILSTFVEKCDIDDGFIAMGDTNQAPNYWPKN